MLRGHLDVIVLCGLLDIGEGLFPLRIRDALDLVKAGHRIAHVGGVGAGRLGSQAFLLIAPESDPSLPDAGTQIALHQPRLKDEIEASAFVQLAAQLGVGAPTGIDLDPSAMRVQWNG